MRNKGFTLIEIMVSLALFAVVAVVAIGAFLKIIDANRRAEAIESAVNDTNFALESMVRDLRVGTDYHCYSVGTTPSPSITPTTIQTCPTLGPNMLIEFNSSQTAVQSGVTCNLIHAYDMASGVIQKAEQTSCSQSYGSGTYIFEPLTSTSSDLTISAFSLQVTGNPASTPQIQPKVFILVSGTAGGGSQSEDTTAFTLQTTASQRVMQ